MTNFCYTISPQKKYSKTVIVPPHNTTIMTTNQSSTPCLQINVDRLISEKKKKLFSKLSREK